MDRIVAPIIRAVMGIVDVPFALAQRVLGQRRIAWLFLAPNLFFFGVFAFLPIGLNFAYALTGGDQMFLAGRPYVGVDNFSVLLSCRSYFDPNSCEYDLFWRSVWNTLVFVMLQVGFMVAISLLTAIILNRDLVARGFFRAVFFFPVLLSPVVVALIWKWILQRHGVLNAVFVALGIAPVDWLLSANLAFGWSIFISVWAHMGFYTLILLAGLQAIPRDVYEAAQLDRASRFRIFRRITLPLLAPTLLVVLVLSLIKGVQTFDEIFAFTGGGPGSATTFIVQSIYHIGFAGTPRNHGLAAAASLILALVLVVLTTLQFWANKGHRHE
ncbi:carbohydrate ABC transporter permease [Rhizobium sp. SSA_523]|uniref:carbohydrate ABC transporter permease n=1 Tax=Rhizobium sp. SSA_523 TaxID=2952477 RepID=UPI0020911918|nr:sugar ABC transporter permease [Rhizobium sp. SSA_523]MCO5731514.1 sugar ABC transporter permease [Rhizobium sp. SSA_523]WKC21970.1 sugar ABC transporter permease [Rhizobium sp. SSA_523]